MEREQILTPLWPTISETHPSPHKESLALQTSIVPIATNLSRSWGVVRKNPPNLSSLPSSSPQPTSCNPSSSTRQHTSLFPFESTITIFLNTRERWKRSATPSIMQQERWAWVVSSLLFHACAHAILSPALLLLHVPNVCTIGQDAPTTRVPGRLGIRRP